MQDVLIYDMESQNNQLPHSDVRDEPEPPSSSRQHHLTNTELVQVRSQSANKTQQLAPPQPKVEKERKKSENIVFYEEDLTKSTNSVEYDETNRGFLKKHGSNSEDQENQSPQQLQQLNEWDEEDLEEKPEKEIVPTQKTLPTHEVLVSANVDTLIRQPVPLNYRLKCYLAIERGMLGLGSVYRLFLGDEKQFLMAAKKENFKYYSNFLISEHPHHIHKRTQNWIGRLQSNFLGTQFKYFSVKDKFETLKLTASYNKNFVGFMGPRTFNVTKVDPKAKKGKYLNSLASILERNERSKLLEMTTAQPVLVRGKYRLQFGGKVRIPSSKNFILKQGEQQALLFGKINKDTYLVQVSYPLSLFEAFGVCLTSLDSKLMVS